MIAVDLHRGSAYCLVGSAHKTMRRLVIAGLVLAFSVSAGAAWAEPVEVADDARSRALELFRQGNSAFADGDMPRAHAAYSAAWRLSQSYDIACNLARVEAELGRKPEAARHLRYCLNNFSASSRPELREAERKFRALMVALEGELGQLSISGLSDGAEAYLNGESVGRAPFTQTLFVEPGLHRVEVRRGTVGDRFSIEIAGGETRELQVGVAPAYSERSLVTDAAAVRLESQRLRGAKPWVLIGGAAATAAGIALGSYAVMSAVSQDNLSDRLIVRAIEELGPEGCQSTTRADVCMQLSASIERAESRESLARTSFIAAAVFGALTVTAWLAWPTESAEPRIGLVAVAAPSGAGLRLISRY
jgi:hypothetical protein